MKVKANPRHSKGSPAGCLCWQVKSLNLSMNEKNNVFVYLPIYWFGFVIVKVLQKSNLPSWAGCDGNDRRANTYLVRLTPVFSLLHVFQPTWAACVLIAGGKWSIQRKEGWAWEETCKPVQGRGTKIYTHNFLTCGTMFKVQQCIYSWFSDALLLRKPSNFSQIKQRRPLNELSLLFLDKWHVNSTKVDE